MAIDLYGGSKSLTGSNNFTVDKNPLDQSGFGVGKLPDPLKALAEFDPFKEIIHLLFQGSGIDFSNAQTLWNSIVHLFEQAISQLNLNIENLIQNIIDHLQTAPGTIALENFWNLFENFFHGGLAFDLAKVLHYPDPANATLPGLVSWVFEKFLGTIFPHRIPIVPISHLVNATVNLLQNPAFEGSPFLADEAGEWTLDEDVSYDGTGGSARIDANSKQHTLMTLDLIPVSFGQTLQVTAWIKTAGMIAAANSIAIGIVEYQKPDGSDEPTFKTLARSSADGDTDWIRWLSDYNTPLGVAAVRMFVEVRATAKTGKIYFDNLFLGKKGLLEIAWVNGLSQHISEVWANLEKTLGLDKWQEFLDLVTGQQSAGILDFHLFIKDFQALVAANHENAQQNWKDLLEKIKALFNVDQLIAHFKEQTGLDIGDGPAKFFQSLVDRVKFHSMKDGRSIDLSSPDTLFGSIQHLIQNIVAGIQDLIDHFQTQTGLDISDGPVKFFDSLIAKLKAHNTIDLTSHATLFSGLRPLMENIWATIQQMIDHFQNQTGLDISDGPAKFFQSLVAHVKFHSMKDGKSIDLSSPDTLFGSIQHLIANIVATIQQVIDHFQTQTGLDISDGPVKFFDSLIAKFKTHTAALPGNAGIGVDLGGPSPLLGSIQHLLASIHTPAGWQSFLDTVTGQPGATHTTLQQILQHLSPNGQFNATHLTGQIAAANVGGVGGFATLDAAFSNILNTATTNATQLQATWDQWMSALTGVQNSTGDPELTSDQIAQLMATVTANAATIAQIQAATQAGGSGVSGGDDFERVDGTGVNPGWGAWQVSGGSKFTLDGHEAVWGETGAASEVRYRRTDPKDARTVTPFQAVTRVNGVRLAQSQALGTGCGVDEVYGRVSGSGRSYVVAYVDKKAINQWEVKLRYAAGGVKNPCFISSSAAPLQAGGWTQEPDGTNSQSSIGGSARVDGGVHNLLGSDLVAVQANNIAEASAWVKTSGFSGAVTVGLALYRTAGGSDAPTYQTLATSNQTGTSDWTSWSGSFAVPAGVLAVRLYLTVNNTAGQMWFDNVSVATQVAEQDLGPSAICPAPAAGVRYTLECGDPEGSTDAIHTYRVLRNGAPILVYTDAAKVTSSLDGNRGWGFGGKSVMGGLAGELSPSSVNAVTIADNPPTTTVGTYLRAYRKDTAGITHPDGDAPLPNSCINFVERNSADLAWDIPSQTLAISKPGPYTITSRLEFAKDIVGTDRWDMLLFVKGVNAKDFVLVARGGEQPGATGNDAHAIGSAISYYLEAGDQVRIGIGNKGTGLAASISIVGDAAGVSTWMTVTKGA